MKGGRAGEPAQAAPAQPMTLQAPAQPEANDRRRLFNVRVIQRNLVYVVGLTMNNCKEEVRATPQENSPLRAPAHRRPPVRAPRLPAAPAAARSC